MDRKPPDRDNALLERLNALKKSSVSFDTSLQYEESLLPLSSRALTDLSPLQQPEDRPQQPHEVADITARFRNLKSSRQNDPDALIASIAEAPSSADDAPPSPTIEELIADLGPEEQWQLDQDDTTRIHTLLQDSKEALSATTTTANNERSSIRCYPAQPSELFTE
ncbi:MAG: hypothetical protein L6R40_001363 [Gallowayella cf. fulva]|nr:MAG: hypothetical protein L6R40_001363 [Xanthomendoza cf. fulva]